MMRQPAGIAQHERYEGLSKYALGLWRYSSRVDDLIDVDANGDPMRRRSQGGYLLAERTMWRINNDRKRNLTAFARYSFADGDTIAIDQTLNMGVRILGPMASRAYDIVALGWTRGQLAKKYRRQQLVAGVATNSAEEALELTWRMAVTRWLGIQPSLQHVRHPGGVATMPNANVAGVRVDITF